MNHEPGDVNRRSLLTALAIGGGSVSTMTDSSRAYAARLPGSQIEHIDDWYSLKRDLRQLLIGAPKSGGHGRCSNIIWDNLVIRNYNGQPAVALFAASGSGVILIGLALLAEAAGIRFYPNFVNTGLSGLGSPSMGPPVFSPQVLNLLLVLASTASIVATLQRASEAPLYIGFSVILFFGTRGIWRILLPAARLIGLPALLIYSESFRRRLFFETTSSDKPLADPTKVLSEVNSSGRFDLWENVLTCFF
jgi:hypothetical protein